MMFVHTKYDGPVTHTLVIDMEELYRSVLQW